MTIASCGHRASLVGVSKDVRPLSIDPVGRYAIRFHWSDGHSTGIYTFERLRELCPCPICDAEARTR